MRAQTRTGWLGRQRRTNQGGTPRRVPPPPQARSRAGVELPRGGSGSRSSRRPGSTGPGHGCPGRPDCRRRAGMGQAAPRPAPHRARGRIRAHRQRQGAPSRGHPPAPPALPCGGLRAVPHPHSGAAGRGRPPRRRGAASRRTAPGRTRSWVRRRQGRVLPSPDRSVRGSTVRRPGAGRRPLPKLHPAGPGPECRLRTSIRPPAAPGAGTQTRPARGPRVPASGGQGPSAIRRGAVAGRRERRGVSAADRAIRCSGVPAGGAEPPRDPSRQRSTRLEEAGR
jgi:hypothetical protein